jgi:hypothetical protein
MTIVAWRAGFFGDTIRPDPAALWIPIGQEPAMRGAASLLGRADQNWLYAIGRVAPSASPARIGAHVTAALQQWLSAQPFVGEGERPLIPRQHVVVVPAAGGVGLAQAQYGRSLTVLFAASALVLLIAIANLANLLLAGRTADRRRSTRPSARRSAGCCGNRSPRESCSPSPAASRASVWRPSARAR